MEGLGGGSESEIISKTLQMEHKLFYFDLKENPRGRYLKISEKSSVSRSTIIVPVSGVVWFVNLFSYYADGDDPNISSKELELESKELQLDKKVFYFDVGENQRGRFLRVSESSGNRGRSTIIVPAGDTAGKGWASFRDILAEIDEAVQELPSSKKSVDHPQASEDADHLAGLSDVVHSSFLPEDNAEMLSRNLVNDGTHGLSSSSGNTGVASSTRRTIRAEQKKFFFDLGSNARGQYLRISEVTGGDRSSIILPVSALEQFHETLGEFVEMVRSQSLTGTEANVHTIAPARRQADS